MSNPIKGISFPLWLALFAGMSGILAAQTPQPTPPPVPRFPSGNVSYTVGVTVHSTIAPDPGSTPGNEQRGKAVPKQSQITGVRVTCINHLIRYQIAWQGGGTSERWVEGKQGLDFSQDPRSKTVFLSVPNYGPGSLTSVIGPVNNLLNGVNTGNLAGKQTIGANTCFHYKWKIVMTPMIMEYQAWVDEKTGVLAAMDDGFAFYTFAFDPTPPAGPLVMPPEFKARLDRYLTKTKPVEHL